jgi:hypothetical protein
MDLEPWQWLVAGIAALIVGASKTGLPGGVVLAVAMFAQVLPARQSTGALLPLLICADFIAISLLYRHVHRPSLLKIFPWSAIGVVLGALLLGRINDAQMARLIGSIIVLMVSHQLWRGSPPNASARFNLALPLGLGAGFTSMIANAASPFTSVYFLSARLPKVEFVGTTALFFLVVNLFKLPFTAGLGLITFESLKFNLLLVPLVLLGAALGRIALQRMVQKLFERLVLLLALMGGLRLLIT